MKPRAVGVIFADQVQVGDVVFASYHRSARNAPNPDEAVRCCGQGDEGDLVCAWVEVYEIKHHTDTTVSLFSRVVDAPDTHRWVEYPLDAPIVCGWPS